MRKLGRTSLYTRSRSLDDRVSSLERRYDPDPLCCNMPVFKATVSTGFTVVDGAYYGIAQTIGANPSANGIADTFEFFNDLGDGSGVFAADPVGTGYSLHLNQETDTDGWMLAYDSGIIFDASIDTTTVTVSLYLGRGVGGGGFDNEFVTLEAVMASNVSSTGTPTIRLTGSIPVTNFGGGNLPTITPVLLVEGGTPTVQFGWCYYTILSAITSSAIIP